MKGLSEKEIKAVSFLELNERLFFKKDDIKRFFKNRNEVHVYIHRLMKKGRVLKLSKSKYYLIPVRAFEGQWAEHPFIIVDEIFDGQDYYIGGMAAAHYWGLIEQIPTRIAVYTAKKQGHKSILNFTIIFKRLRRLENRSFVKRSINNHTFFIASKKEAEKWLKSK